MNIEERLTKVSMFMDGELSEFEMNNVEKMLDKDADMKSFIINSVKANAYIKHSLKVQTSESEVVMPDNIKPGRAKFLLRAASIIFIIGIGILMSTITSDRTGSNFALASTIINPMYQNAINTALENNKSGVAYKSSLTELGTDMTIVPEKTYRYNNSSYVRKFLITYNLGEKIIGAQGFAERKSKKIWEIKTLAF